MDPELVLKFVDHKIDGKTVFYTVQVYEKKTGKSWNLPTRYSQLYDLHVLCEERLPKGELPDFPPKKMFGNTNPDFVIRRKKELQNYYNTLFRSTPLDKLPELKKFLEQNKPKDMQPETKKEPPVNGQKPIENVQQNQEIQMKKKFEELYSETVAKFIDISNEYFNPPDEGMIKRKKMLFDKVKIEMHSKLLPTLSLPKGTAQNFTDFWAVNYFEEREDAVSDTLDQLSSLKIQDQLREQGIQANIVKVI